ncbi:beta-ketoacyl-ACP synthase III [Desulfotomaculum copahuensis]|uniref:Beta-ketoacyl-[acyl-carrier-protein] synthase III n=1 Tax=Desulfotomaculum copahuensis TaxID=1838280 RepID=A0A1B7LDT2_9FIRM|nr:beta-ketoacyl-ACP synthase III [Desulfotomaculum copahuensis]OAT81268.1 3-oxoacyl-ACP synthase [Desulfotomaculum copahuensis]
MPEQRAAITGLGTYVPEKILTNAELEKMVDTSDEWITTRTGIRERRIAAPGEATSDLAREAARRALADAGVEAREIDLIIVATNTPDMLFPATACLLQESLGAERAGAFDLLAGCTGFIYALVTGGQFIAAGGAQTVLAVGAETLSRIVNWRDRNTCVLFGDGAGAAVLRAAPAGYGLLASRLGAHGAGGPLLCLPAGGSRRPACRETVEQDLHFVHMNGREVFKFAVKTMEEGTRGVMEDAGLSVADIDFLIPHQANIRIIDAAVKRLGLAPERVLVNVDRYGNTSTASIPLALQEARQAGRIKDGDNVVLVGFGAGLTWAAAAVRWFDARRPE